MNNINNNVIYGKHKKSLIAYMLIVMMVLTMVVPFSIIKAKAADDTVYLQHGGEAEYFGWHTNMFKTKSSEWGDRSAYCLEPTKVAPSEGNYDMGKTFSGYTGSNPMYVGSGEAMRYIVYYMALDGPGRNEFEKSFGSICKQIGYSYDKESEIGLVHVLLSYFRGVAGSASFTGLTTSQIDTLCDFAKKEFYSDFITKQPKLPSNDYFRVFEFNTGTNTQNMLGWRYVPTGKIDLQKVSGNKDITDGNACYSLEGAIYGVYDSNGTEVDKLTTNASGFDESIELKAGNYKVKEITPPKGYALDNTTYNVTIEANKTTRVNKDSVSDLPTGDPLYALIQKLDAETGKASPLGGATLGGAQFTLKYYDGQYSSTDLSWMEKETPTRTWILETDSEGWAFLDEQSLASGSDKLYFSSNGNPTIPIGTLSVQETKPPTGYLVDNTIRVQNIVSDGKHLEHTHVLNAYEMPDKVIRGDLRFNKIEDGSNQRMANVPFSITSKTTGESHIIVTDKNGNANTSSAWNKHSNNTNKGETDKDGVWFGGTEVNDEFGALPYDTYVIDELPCESNEGKILLKGIEVVIERNIVTVNMGTLTNDLKDIPKLSTTASDGDDGDDFITSDKEATINDKVSFNGLTPNVEYVLKGILMDKSTGEPLLVNEKQITSDVTFTPDKADGSVVVKFDFDASSLDKIDVVVFETLYRGDKETASHKDINDKGQTVTFNKIEIGTTALDKKSGTHEAEESSNVTIIDTVSYKGLTVGKEYTLKGILMDKATKEPLLIKGKEVSSEVKFTPKEANGTVNVEFNFDAKGLAGKQTVVFESLYLGENEIATHTDINDKDQTIKFEKEEKNVPKSSQPKTGDDMNIALAIILFVISMGATGVVVYKLRKMKKERFQNIEE